MLRREELFEDFVGSLEHALDAEDVSGSAANGAQTILQPNLRTHSAAQSFRWFGCAALLWTRLFSAIAFAYILCSDRRLMM